MAEPARAVETGGSPETDGGSPQGPSLEHRVDRLEDEVRDIKEILRNDVVPYLRQIGDMKADIAAMKATLPHLATKEDVANCKTELTEKIGRVEADLGAKISEVKGMVARTPTALQLAGFVVAIFVASGLIRWVFGP